MRFPNIDHVYVVHCESFTDRRKHMMKFVEELSLSSDYYTFMVNTHKDTLSDELIETYYTLDQETRSKELQVIGEDKFLTQGISKGALSCGINHLLIWKDIIEKKYTKHVMILEDDATMGDNFVSSILEVCAELKNHDIVSLENGSNLKIQRYGITTCNDQWIYKTPDGRMRCTCAYLINPATCKKLVALNQKRKFSLEIDMQMWLYAKLQLYDVHWIEPTIFSQGSQNGIFPSQICPNFSSIYKYVQYENKKCVCMGMTYIATVYDMVIRHNCSALFYNTTGLKESTKYPIKVIDETLPDHQVPEMVKRNLFDGHVDVFAYGLPSSSLLKLLVFDSIAVNPNVIICSETHKELLAPRYKMVNDCLFVRHSQVIDEEKNDMELLD